MMKISSAKIFITPLIRICIVIGLIWGIISFTTFNHYKSVLRNIVLERYGLDIEASYDVHILVFPTPRIVFEDIYILHNDVQIIRARTLELPLSFKLFFERSNLESIAKTAHFTDGALFVDNYLAYHATNNVQISTNTIILENIEIVRTDPFASPMDSYDNLIHINKLTLTQGKMPDTLKLNGALTQNDVETSVSGEIQGLSSRPLFVGTLKGDDIEIVTQNISSQQDPSHVTYTLQTTVTDIDILLHRLGLLSGNNPQDKLFNNTPIKINAALSSTGDSFLIQNFLIDSEYVGRNSGSLKLDLSDRYEVTGHLVIDSINLDALLTSTAKTRTKLDLLTTTKEALVSDLQLNISPLLLGSFDVNIKRITFHGDEIKNSQLNLDLFGDQISINNLSFLLPGETTLEIKGLLKNNSIRPEFNGKILMETNKAQKFFEWTESTSPTFQKLAIKSQISIIPYDVSFFDTSFTYDNNSITGSISLSQEGDSALDTTTTMIDAHSNKIDLDQLGFSPKPDQMILDLYKADYDKTGNAYYEKVGEDSWLSKMHGTLRLKIATNQLIFKKEVFTECYLSGSFMRNKFDIEEFYINSNFLSASGNIAMSSPLFRPLLTGALDIRYIDLQKSLTLLPSTGYLKDAAQQDRSLTRNVSTNSLEQNVNFFCASQYDAKFKIQLDQILFTHNLLIKNIGLNFKLADGILTFNEEDLLTEGASRGGKIVGDIVLSEGVPRFSVNFSLYNFDPKIPLETFLGFNRLSGYMSIAGVLQGKAMTKQDMISSINGDVIFVGKNINFSGLQMDDIIKSTDPGTASTQNRLENLNYYALYGSTSFDEMKGRITVSNGIASIENTTLTNKRLSGVYSANISLIDYAINAITQIAFIPSNDYGSGALPLTIITSGRLPTPNSKLDVTPISKYIQGLSPNKSPGNK